MAKAKTVFFCQECGYESTKWMGQCPACHAWNSFVEEPVRAAVPGKKSAPRGSGPAGGAAAPVRLRDVDAGGETRTRTGIEELDRVLGGGIVTGSLVLIGGDPGIGKSTLLLQVCQKLAEEGHKVLYISGEESLRQIRMRASRLGSGTEEMLLLCETDLAEVEAAIGRVEPELVVVDSIQTMYSGEVSSSPGSVSQVRETTGTLLRIAKGSSVSIFIVGHVTKEGAVAGPRVLEHMVDTVLYFEGENHASYRVLRAVKNRFGSTNEIGVFEMMDDGLHEVPNPSEFMLSGRPEDASGAAVTCSMEGTRPVLLEIQGLCARTSFGYPRRTANGFDYNRLHLLIAVIERRLHEDLSTQDAYVNIAGGIRISEPAADLAIVMALLSSLKDRPIGDDTIVFGEVGLSGEIRAVSHAMLRVQEAKKLGFSKVILPAANRKNLKDTDGITVISVSNIREAAEALGLSR